MAKLVDGLCQRFHCLPSALMNEDADYLIRLVALAEMGKPEQHGE